MNRLGHLTPEAFFEFIDQGDGQGPAGDHLMECPECLHVLDMVLLAEAPATAEEEAILAAATPRVYCSFPPLSPWLHFSIRSRGSVSWRLRRW